MRVSDEAMQKLVDALAAEVGAEAAADFEVEANCLIRRYRREQEQRTSDLEAARLLYVGAATLAERYNRHRSTIYRRAERGRKLSRDESKGATNPA